MFYFAGKVSFTTFKISRLANGFAYPEQWGVISREVDFYDVKGDLENSLRLMFPHILLEYKPSTHPALHPGQSAEIYFKDQKIGILGALHPIISQTLEISD
ncbi:MAG: phenylalanine--tRNA ligase subunit beta, partial [Gammaproteobacteria bacterium]|nr:phenylalanine--tRNA ligase subunit beta [Gammaproteobacteria bacterium]